MSTPHPLTQRRQALAQQLGIHNQPPHKQARSLKWAAWSYQAMLILWPVSIILYAYTVYTNWSAGFALQEGFPPIGASVNLLTFAGLFLLFRRRYQQARAYRQLTDDPQSATAHVPTQQSDSKLTIILAFLGLFFWSIANFLLPAPWFNGSVLLFPLVLFVFIAFTVRARSPSEVEGRSNQ